MKEAGISFTEMIKTLGKKTVAKTEEKTKEIKDKYIEAINLVHRRKQRIFKLLEYMQVM